MVDCSQDPREFGLGVGWGGVLAKIGIPQENSFPLLLSALVFYCFVCVSRLITGPNRAIDGLCLLLMLSFSVN